MNEEVIQEFINKFPKLLPTLTILNENNIQYLIGGSGSLFLLGNKRIPDDVDIYIQDKDHDKVDELFGITSFQYKSKTEDVRNSNPENDHSIQITSHLNITIHSTTYNLQITDEVLNNKIRVAFQNTEFFLLPTEDVLLIKAILQRGKDVGKNDLEDIYNYIKIHPINRTYLNARISALKAEDRVGNIFNNHNLV